MRFSPFVLQGWLPAAEQEHEKEAERRPGLQRVERFLFEGLFIDASLLLLTQDSGPERRAHHL